MAGGRSMTNFAVLGTRADFDIDGTLVLHSTTPRHSTAYHICTDTSGRIVHLSCF